MELRLTQKANEDIQHFTKSGEKGILKKIELLLIEIEQSPFIGTGKPEALKHQFSGVWSRRINKEHRIIYEVKEEYVLIHSLKGHYS